MIKTRQTCRVCGNWLTDILNLGEHCLPGYDGLEGRQFIQRKVPLVLARCNPEVNETACGLVQLRHTTPGSMLYPRYFYRSGINQTMTKHLGGLAQRAIDVASPSKIDVIVDIGCNDGTSLAYYAARGYRSLFGFDPAKNMAEYSRKTGAKITEDYFTEATFRKAVGSKRLAKLITSIAMFYDLEDPGSFVESIAKCLSPKGVWVFEQSYLPSMLRQNAFDTICHEHLEYYSLAIVENLLSKHGLKVIDVYLNDINGGSFQVFAGHRNREVSAEADNRIQSLRDAEFELALETSTPYQSFAGRIDEIRKDLVRMLQGLKHRGKKVFAYGASTKGAITLQSCGITSNLVECCADRNPIKWGSQINGTGIPIVSEEEARAKQPDYFLVLPWHFIKEFQEREKEFLDRGGNFIIPMPRVTIIGRDE